MSKWTLIYSEKFIAKFSSLDRPIQKMINAWIEKHLANVDNPKALGKPLTGNLKGYWRYRVGSYRIIVMIDQNKLVISAVNVGHRSNIYQNKLP